MSINAKSIRVQSSEFRKGFTVLCTLYSVLFFLTAASPAHAVAVGAAQLSRDEPVLLEAAQVDYDKETQFVIAQGNVSVTQGDTIVLADTLTYDQRNNLVFAQGNVSVLEPGGNVYFAEELEFASDMKSGVVDQFRARLADNSLFAAREGIRLSEDKTELHQAVYSPCSITCADGGTKEPLWQIRADHVLLDRTEQKVTYRDAYMDFYGVPVIYTPYLSHAMPGAPNKSGFLLPEYKHDDNLGTVVKVPFYWAIAPDRDATFMPMYLSEEAPVLAGEYRQLWDHGSMKLTGSITQPDDRDALGNPERGSRTRGHIFGSGVFSEGEELQWGFNIRRTTDDTYLRRYDFNNDPLLTSRLYGEGFDFTAPGSRSYVIAQGLAFQGLQQQDDSRTSPLVMPVIDAFYQTAPMAWNSRFSLTGGTMVLTRDDGTDTRRASLAGEWMLPYVSGGGHVFELGTRLRADAYSIDDFRLANGALSEGAETRIIPQASLGWRYPLINRFEHSSLVVEPVVNAIVSPNSGNSFRIPNEDSAVPEFTDVNLFSDNRFAGYDRLETGPRVNYGLRGQLQFEGNDNVSAMIGQAYRVNDDPLFPISNDLSSRFSDYVGRIGFTVSPFDLVYRFRVDKDNFSPSRSEVTGNYGQGRLGLSLNYLNLKDDPVLATKEEISGGVSFRLTEFWSLYMASHRDLDSDRNITANAGLIFKNECVTLTTMAGRDYTQDRDFQQSTSFKMQLALKNLN